MSKRPKNKIRVSFIGENARDVTGSMTLVEMSGLNILLECGLYQSTSIREDYKVNSSKFPFRPKNIDYIFLTHAHIDHSGRIPALFAQGCKAKVVCPKGTKDLFRILALDSAYIINRDCEFINSKSKSKASPIYTSSDVYESLKYFEEYPCGAKVKLNDRITLRFTPSGHILSSAQIELWLTEGNQTKKILYTGDLGNSIPKYLIEPLEKVKKANLVICESTYSNKSHQIGIKDRETDLNKIKTIITETCLEKKGKVLFPTFSLDRMQNILIHLYQIFGESKDFKIPILIDSPLAAKLTGTYLRLLGEEREILENALAWENVQVIDTYEESVCWQRKREPLIVLAASGFMQAGRSRTWAKSILPDPESHILFIGFASEGSLAGKLRNTKTKTVSIDGRTYKNRCGITTLYSFSSHIQYQEMLDYYSDINCEKICLVHGEYKRKCEFGKILQDSISEKNKTSKVVVTNKSTSILI